MRSIERSVIFAVICEEPFHARKSYSSPSTWATRSSGTWAAASGSSDQPTSVGSSFTAATKPPSWSVLSFGFNYEYVDIFTFDLKATSFDFIIIAHKTRHCEEVVGVYSH